MQEYEWKRRRMDFLRPRVLDRAGERVVHGFGDDTGGDGFDVDTIQFHSFDPQNPPKHSIMAPRTDRMNNRNEREM